MTVLDIGREIKLEERSKLGELAGILLIIAGCINILARIGLIIDIIITILLIGTGIAILTTKSPTAYKLGLLCSGIGIIYPIVKLWIFYFILPPLVEISPEELLKIGSVFLIPMFIVSVLAAWLLLRVKRA